MSPVPMRRERTSSDRRRVKTLAARCFRRSAGRLSRAEATELAELMADYHGVFGGHDRISWRSPGSFSRNWCEFPRERAEAFREIRIGNLFGNYGPHFGWTF